MGEGDREGTLKVSLKDQREVPMVLWAGEEQVEKWKISVCSRKRKTRGARLKGNLVGGEGGMDKHHQVMGPGRP